MSHFTVVVMLPKDFIIDRDRETLNQDLGLLIDRYDENREVLAYMTDCFCIGSIARHEVNMKVNDALGTISECRDDFFERHGELTPEEQGKFWKSEVYIPRSALEDELFNANPRRAEPNAECEECHGTGQYRTQYNPDSKWDWFSLGGRWDGAFPNGKNFASTEELVKSEFMPFAIVTPDEVWYEKGRMGFFAMVHNERTAKDWETEVTDLFNQHTDHMCALLDCHI